MFTYEKTEQVINSFESVIVNYRISDESRLDKSGHVICYYHQAAITVESPETKTMAEIVEWVNAAWIADAEKKVAQYEAVWAVQEAMNERP